MSIVGARQAGKQAGMRAAAPMAKPPGDAMGAPAEGVGARRFETLHGTRVAGNREGHVVVDLRVELIGLLGVILKVAESRLLRYEEGPRPRLLTLPMRSSTLSDRLAQTQEVFHAQIAVSSEADRRRHLRRAVGWMRNQPARDLGSTGEEG